MDKLGLKSCFCEEKTLVTHTLTISLFLTLQSQLSKAPTLSHTFTHSHAHTHPHTHSHTRSPLPPLLQNQSEDKIRFSKIRQFRQKLRKSNFRQKNGKSAIVATFRIEEKSKNIGSASFGTWNLIQNGARFISLNLYHSVRHHQLLLKLLNTFICLKGT